MRPPRRLLDDAALPRALRDDLTRARVLPYAYDARVGLAALQGALAGLAVPAAAAAASASQGPAAGAASTAAVASSSTAPAAGAAAVLAGAGAGVKLGMSAGVAALVAASVFVATERDAPQRAVHTFVQPGGGATSNPRPAAPAVRAVAPEPARAQLPVHETTAPAPAAAMPRTQPPALRREVAQLGRVKALLPREPARAYRLAQQGHRRFARGVLHHEREGLAVLALFALDRRAQAEQRARAFLARYPDSPLRAPIEDNLRAP